MYANRATRPATEWFVVALVFLLIVSTLVVRFDLAATLTTGLAFLSVEIESPAAALKSASATVPSDLSMVSMDIATTHSSASGNRNERGFFRDY